MSDIKKSFPNRGKANTHDCTEEQFNQMWKKQKGLCDICNTEMLAHGTKGNSAFVDHCHTSGETRGILCNHCNRGLGGFLDDPEVMEKAAKFIRNHRKHSYWWRVYLG